MFITIITDGTIGRGKPTDCARSSRTASLTRASVKLAATSTHIQYVVFNRASSLRENGARTLRKPGGRSGSCTPNTMIATETKAGITAIQNTAVKLLAKAAMNTIARSGPQAEGSAAQIGGREVGDERVARRSADALADSIDEARRHQPADACCQREYRLGESGQAIAEGGQPFALAEIIAERAGKDLDDRGGGFGDALD